MDFMVLKEPSCKLVPRSGQKQKNVQDVIRASVRFLAIGIEG